jgi:ABC-type nitrate/sulfonate/bicarbonate transport system permease component
MAETGRLTAAADRAGRPRVAPVTLLRIALVAGALVLWEAVAASGLLFQDVVPSLLAIGRALVETITDNTFYVHLYTTFYEIIVGLLIGGLAGLAVGIALGGSPLMARAYEVYLYYLGPCPKIIFFPLMIMWFGVGPGSKIAMGAISCFFPIALNVAGGMREIDKVYLPAMRYPIINGVRLGLGVALIGTLLAETKLSNRGMGYLVIQAYELFRMPEMYSLLIILFVIAVGANALIGRLGGIDTIKRA